MSQKIEIIQLASEVVFQTELSQQFGSMISKILSRLSRTQQRTGVERKRKCVNDVEKISTPGL